MTSTTIFHSDLLLEISKDKESPFYLYSENRIRENIRNLKQAAAPHFKDFRLQYAIKANSNPSILKIAVEEGIGADCSSPLELQLAKRVGFNMALSTYTGNFEANEDFNVALAAKSILNLDDFRRLQDLPRLPEVLSFRINPGVGKGGHAGIVTGGVDAKFGIPHEQTRQAYEAAMRVGVKRFGIHMMTGSNNLEADYFAQITETLFDIIETHIKPLQISLDFINIGGGLGVPYRSTEKALDIKATFASVAKIFQKRLSQLQIGNPALAIEPGRYLVADAGVLVTRVHHVKRSYKNFIGIDGGMTTMIRPAMYQSYHSVRPLVRREGKAEEFWICGQICENTDVYPEPYFFTAPQVGDILAIENCGAYGHVMSSNYNHRLRPAEYLLRSNGDVELIRRADREQDLFLFYPEFKW